MDSIQAQTFTDWEVVIVDDGSHDDSVNIAKRRAGLDQRIRVFQNDRNLGTYGTQQAALNHSRGPLIAVMNSDDLWAPEKLARQVEAMDANSDVLFSFVLGHEVDEQGQKIEKPHVHKNWPRTPRVELLPFLLSENRILASGTMFRREKLVFDPSCRYSGDWVCLLEHAMDSAALCIDEDLTSWRQHPNNSYQRSLPQAIEEIRVRRAIESHAEIWLTSPLNMWQIRTSLAWNMLHLSWLLLLLGDGQGARIAIRRAAVLPHLWIPVLKRILRGTFRLWSRDRKLIPRAMRRTVRDELRGQVPLLLNVTKVQDESIFRLR